MPSSCLPELRRGVCGLGLQREGRQFTGSLKSKQMFARPSLAMGHRGLIKWALLGPALSHSLIHLKLWVAMLITPFLEQVLYLHLFT